MHTQPVWCHKQHDWGSSVLLQLRQESGGGTSGIRTSVTSFFGKWNQQQQCNGQRAIGARVAANVRWRAVQSRELVFRTNRKHGQCAAWGRPGILWTHFLCHATGASETYTMLARFVVVESAWRHKCKNLQITSGHVGLDYETLYDPNSAAAQADATQNSNNALANNQTLQRQARATKYEPYFDWVIFEYPYASLFLISTAVFIVLAAAQVVLSGVSSEFQDAGAWKNVFKLWNHRHIMVWWWLWWLINSNWERWRSDRHRTEHQHGKKCRTSFLVAPVCFCFCYEAVRCLLITQYRR